MVYRVVIVLGRVLVRVLGLRVEVSGLEHVPRSGPAVLASTHVSFLDFLLLGLVGKEAGGRKVRFLARHEIWSVAPVGWAMRAMGHIPVDRAAPADAYLRARRALRDGEVVGIFAEAGVSRSYTVRSLMPGAAALARETGAPLVPVALWGGQRLLTAKTKPRFRRGVPISIAVGTALQVTRSGSLRADAFEATDRLGHELQRQADRVQAEPRHQPGPGESPTWHPRHLGGSALSVEEAASLQDVPRSARPVTWAPAARVPRVSRTPRPTR